jgi:beta-N-acetylhexosaminidase
MNCPINLSKYIIVTILLFVTSLANAQQPGFIESINQQNRWVDSVYDKLSRKNRIAQLIFVRAHTNLGKRYADSVAKVIKKERLGGVVFFQGGPVRQAELTNAYQKVSKVPLLVAMDGEWGLGMRLDSTVSYPYQMALGAIQDNTLIYKMGQYVAYDFKRLGMHINFAPDMDINNNPDNPVINYRSFGDNKYNVARKGIAYMKGMQDAGLITTAKHFPGHGDTNVDSHLGLPVLPFTAQRLDSLEEYPFKEAVREGLSGVMIAHMNIPALDTTKNLPSTLSRPIITGNLRNVVGFKGLVVSDAMEMRGVVKYFPDGEADVLAFLAGNDILELTENSGRAIKKIRKAIRKDRITKEEFEAKVKRVLAAKYWAGLNQYQPVNSVDLVNDLNRAEGYTLVQQLCDASVTLLKGDSLLQQFDPAKKTAIVSIGVDGQTVYQRELATRYTNNTLFVVGRGTTYAQLKQMLQNLKGYEQVIVGIHDSRTRPGSKLDLSSDVKLMIADLASYKNTFISLFANPYTIAGLPGIEKAGGLLVCYQKEEPMQRSAVKVLTKQLKPTGKLPVSVNTFFPNGTGITAMR